MRIYDRDAARAEGSELEPVIEAWQTLLWMAVAYLAGVGTRVQIVRASTRLAWWRLRHRR